MTLKTRRILCILITLFTLIGLLLAYPRLPESMPMHWDINGDVEYGSKSKIWLFAGMMIFFNLMFEALPHMDPRKRNYARFMNEYSQFCVLMNVFLSAFMAALVIQALRPGIFNMTQFVWLALGILFVFIGNMMPKFKSNYSSGIKTPWALSDDENWRKTHRLGGKLMFLSGIVWIAGALLNPAPTIMLAAGLGSIFAASIIPYAMSYYWWVQKEKTK